MVSIGADSTDIYFLVIRVYHLDPQVMFQFDTVLPMVPTVLLVHHVIVPLLDPQVLLHHETLLPEVPLVLLVVLVLLVRIFWLVLFTDKSRVLGEFSCQSERDTFKFTLTFFPETEKFLHHLILHESVL